MRQRRLTLLLVGSGSAVVFVAACADIFGIHSAEVGDGSVPDGSSDAIADVPFDYVVHDAIDFDVNNAVCEGGVPLVDVDAAVWVSSALGADSTSCGAQGSPCKTIGAALQNRGTRNVVYVDNAVYTELVTLGGSASALTLQGGWTTDAGWVPVCDSNKTTIQAPDDASAAVEITSTDGVTLRLLTVKSKVMGTNGTGESVYAVRVVDSPNILIDNVNLVAQNGGGGAPGTTPIGSSAGCASVSGNAGPGTVGTPGALGTVSGVGFVPAVGGDGGSGAAGKLTAPGAGACGMCNGACP